MAEDVFHSMIIKYRAFGRQQSLIYMTVSWRAREFEPFDLRNAFLVMLALCHATSTIILNSVTLLEGTNLSRNLYNVLVFKF